MAYVLLALIALREMKRHVAKIAGRSPRYRPIRNHAFNATFAFSGLLVALSGLLRVPELTTAGWVVCGGTLVGGMSVPCGWDFVNKTQPVWYLRQLFFLSAGTGVLAYAFGML